MVKGAVQNLYLLTPVVSKSSKTETCKVVFFVKLDAGGYIPARVMNSKMPIALSIICELRQQFQKDDLVDAASRNKLVDIMSRDATAAAAAIVKGTTVNVGVAEIIAGTAPPPPKAKDNGTTPCTEEEESQILKVATMFAAFERRGGFKPLDSPDIFVKAEGLKGGHVGKSETVVDASYATVAAWDY